jgi:CheY-like chemotaxis protein
MAIYVAILGFTTQWRFMQETVVLTCDLPFFSWRCSMSFMAHPANSGHKQAGKKSRTRRSAAGRRSEGKKPLIYIVDDEALLLDLAEASLAPGGYRIKKFADPADALKSFAREKPRPDMLVTDYAMGKMNGLELLEKCRTFNPQLKCVLLSGTVGAEVVLNAPSKVDQFVGKPYQPQNLFDLVQRVLPANSSGGTAGE